MTEYIVFADGTSFGCPEQPKAPVSGWPNSDRPWKRISILATVEEAKAAFVDDAQYYREYESQTESTDENGEPTYTTETHREDLSDYSIAGEIVDHRDGTITVYMGKLTEKELLEQAFDALMLEVLGGGLDESV